LDFRRFPPPWSVEETDACFIVRDKNRQALAYVYFEGDLSFARLLRHEHLSSPSGIDARKIVMAAVISASGIAILPYTCNV
jgi:hypothetical protein